MVDGEESLARLRALDVPRDALSVVSPPNRFVSWTSRTATSATQAGISSGGCPPRPRAPLSPTRGGEDRFRRRVSNHGIPRFCSRGSVRNSHLGGSLRAKSTSCRTWLWHTSAEREPFHLPFRHAYAHPHVSERAASDRGMTRPRDALTGDRRISGVRYTVRHPQPHARQRIRDAQTRHAQTSPCWDMYRWT